MANDAFGQRKNEGIVAGQTPGQHSAPASAHPTEALPPSGPPGPDAPSERSGDRVVHIVAVVAGFVVLAVAAFFVARALSGSDASDSAGVPVRLVRADEPGPSPFFENEWVPMAELRTAAAEVGRELELRSSSGDEGDESGLRVWAVSPSTLNGPLYAAASKLSSSMEPLIDAVRSDERRRAVWAEAMSIEEADVIPTIESMPVVLLTRDTAVTHIGYVEGEPVRSQAILQAGTPVLVDDEGLPAVHVVSGNPLQPAGLVETMEVEGDHWADFNAEEIIAIERTGDDEAEVLVQDLDDGEVRDLSSWSADAVELDGYLVSDADGVHIADDDGELTTVLDHPVAAVVDDGNGGLLYQLDRDLSTRPFRELFWRHPTNDAEAAIWHLPAGASEPVVFRAPRTGGNLELHDVGTGSDGEPLLIYFEYPPERDCSVLIREMFCIEETPFAIWAESFDGHRERVFEDSETNVVRMSVRNGRVAAFYAAEVYGSIHFGEVGSGDPERLPGCEFECAVGFAGLVDPDRWLSVQMDGALEICPLSVEPVVCEGVGASLTPDGTVTNLMGDRGMARASGREEDQSGINRTFLIDVSEAPSEVVRELPFTDGVRLLAAPLVRPESTIDPSNTGGWSADPLAPSPTWEEIKNAEIPGMCGRAPNRLVEGRYPGDTYGFDDPQLYLRPELFTGQSGVARGLSSPEGMLTAVGLQCKGAGPDWPDGIVFFGPGGEYVASTDLFAPTYENAVDPEPGVDEADFIASGDWYPSEVRQWLPQWDAAGLPYPSAANLVSMRVDGDELIVRAGGTLPDSVPGAGPDGLVRLRLRVIEGRVELVGLEFDRWIP